MDIRTKLVLTLVAVALASMLVLGVFAFGASREMLQEQALRQLESVAEGKKDDLERAWEAWRDRARLISSRTQLRLSLRRFRATGDAAERARMVRILEDARSSVRRLLYAAVLDPDGREIAAAGDLPEGAERSPGPTRTTPASEPEVTRTADGRLVVTLIEPMRLDGERIGAALVVLDAAELGAIARDYTGLGESGETLLVRAAADGDAEILTPLRHPSEVPDWYLVSREHSASPALRASRGESGAFAGVDDHTGRHVWASTRPLSRPGWGVVVKIDAEEAEQPALALRETLARLALSLAALAIVAGFVLALFISGPIRELASVAARIRAGEENLRADGDREDEIGELARAFNGMTEELMAANEELARRIEKSKADGPGSST